MRYLPGAITVGLPCGPSIGALGGHSRGLKISCCMLLKAWGLLCVWDVADLAGVSAVDRGQRLMPAALKRVTRGSVNVKLQ